jgi:predicted nucleic acid-binding Zn ribbon protein
MPDETTPSEREPNRDGSERAGRDHAREALSQAKSDARRRGAMPGAAGRGGGRKSRTEPGRRARNDDPQSISDVLGGLVSDQGWRERAAIGAVFGRWDQIVGPDLAEHTRPESFADGEVVVRADSAAWATQVRLLAGSLVRRLNEELGHGTVATVKVTGPGANDRRRRWSNG